MRDYDLVLVVRYFRSATAFLSVVRTLGRTLRIAILAETDPNLLEKTGNAHKAYLDLCCKFGADLVGLGKPIRATLAIVQQFIYEDALAKEIRLNLIARNWAGLMTLAMAGLDQHDAFLRQFGIHKVYVPNSRFMKFLLDRRMAQFRYQGVEIVEVGMPYAQHRLFPEFTADWLIAAPTLFSFNTEAGKQQFLGTIHKLLEQIPPTDVVAYKSHNGHSKDYFAPRLHHAIAGIVAKIPTAAYLLELLQKLPWPWLRLQAARVQTCMLHRLILRRATPMPRLTPYSGMSLEAFLPGVRKGVIGGLSNTIWGTLYFDLPYYNCVDASMRKGQSDLLDRSAESLLDLNLQFFGVPYCEGRLDMDSRTLHIVEPVERSGDLVDAIMKDLAIARASCQSAV